jgi:hypothetical protein
MSLSLALIHTWSSFAGTQSVVSTPTGEGKRVHSQVFLRMDADMKNIAHKIMPRNPDGTYAIKLFSVAKNNVCMELSNMMPPQERCTWNYRLYR